MHTHIHTTANKQNDAIIDFLHADEMHHHVFTMQLNN